MSIYRVGLHFDNDHGTTDLYMGVEAENEMHAVAIAAAVWAVKAAGTKDGDVLLTGADAEWVRYV